MVDGYTHGTWSGARWPQTQKYGKNANKNGKNAIQIL